MAAKKRKKARAKAKYGYRADGKPKRKPGRKKGSTNRKAGHRGPAFATRAAMAQSGHRGPAFATRAAAARPRKTKKSSGKNQIPIDVLEHRLKKLKSIVKRRGGDISVCE